MTITTSIIHNLICLVNENQGSSLLLPAHGKGGARATSSLAAHFALQNTLSKSAEKKTSPSEGEAEGGCGGNSASPARAEVHQQADKLRSRRPARSEQSPAKMLQFKINHVELFKE